MKYPLLMLAVLLSCIPVTAQEKQPPIGKSFYLVTGANWASVAFDLTTTQRCIDRGICHEGNPVMGKTLAQRVTVSSSLAVIQTWLSYKQKRQGSKSWWIAPTVDIGMHGFAGGFNLRF